MSLNEFASSDQLEQLLKMCVKSEGVPSSNWSSGDQWIRHACTTLLQDLVSGKLNENSTDTMRWTASTGLLIYLDLVGGGGGGEVRVPWFRIRSLNKRELWQQDTCL